MRIISAFSKFKRIFLGMKIKVENDDIMFTGRHSMSFIIIIIMII